MKRSQGILGGLAVALSVCWVGSSVVSAKVFECTDLSGRRVLTDSLAQLSDCTGVSEGKAFSPPPRPAPAPPPPKEGPSGAPSESAGETVTVPVERVGHLFVVSVTMNGERDARMIVDTGASHTILSQDLALDLGLLADPTSRSVTLNTAGGPVMADVVTVPSIRIGTAEVQNSMAAVFDFSERPNGVEGLLGLTFLASFEVTLDAKRKQLHLRSSSP